MNPLGHSGIPLPKKGIDPNEKATNALLHRSKGRLLHKTQSFPLA